MKIEEVTRNIHISQHFLNERDFIEKLYRDIASIITLMEASSDKYYCDDEDKLSHTIVSSLVNLGYIATEQTKKNGSVDITVYSKNNKYHWIAEAKIGYGNQKIFEGVLQLLTRYVKRDNHAGVIIYYQKDKSATLFSKWVEYMYNYGWVDYCKNQNTLNKIQPLLGHLIKTNQPFISDDCCYADITLKKPMGTFLDVRFFYIDVHHEPLDNSGVNNNSIKRGQAKNTIRDMYNAWKSGEYSIAMTGRLFEALEIVYSEDLDDTVKKNKKK
ncbi:hypothetical protein [Rahnella ecdela]|uniref:Restriction endonuclease n=1 Tax=Rahnella ecdela TaxID=2816250 RepID=A0ABS6LJM4_9GAMM|nr:hypothetical protein [Rahnella ecdela]MBU9847139.1 hypothetical protein [Rahnella ecdela]